MLDTALTWPAPNHVDALAGARMFEDGRAGMPPALALTHSILRSNDRIAPIPALILADAAVRDARADGLPGEFLGATLLQESAFDPRAESAAGAIGIAQFMPETAAEQGVDPYDPYDAIAGAARMLAGYVRTYRHGYADPYSVALAAYNAGPGAVAFYHGVPPYAQTREYIEYIDERWAGIAKFEGPKTSIRTRRRRAR